MFRRGEVRFFLFVLLLSCGFFTEAQHNDEDYQKYRSHFGTKTTYGQKIPHSKGFNSSASLPWIEENIPQNLKPVLVDATLRHGTRFPSTKRINIWKKIIPKFQQYIAESSSSEFSPDFRNSILNWTCQFPNHSSYLLSSLGWEEHVNLSMKYYSMMPEFWQNLLFESERENNDSLIVFSSRKVRCRTSARAFVTGLQLALQGVDDQDHPELQFKEDKVLPENNIIDEETNTTLYGNILVKVSDHTMRFFDHCSKYLHSVDNNDTAEHEFEGFFQSSTFTNIVKRIPGIENKKEAFYIYQLCAFEMAIFGESVWCRLFKEEDFMMLEYASDLKHYYRTGHGYNINYEQACILLESIMDYVEKIEKSRKPMAILRFGHAETLIPLMSHLEFYRDAQPLKSDNFEEHRKRAFRTGMISPFSGNMAIIVYESADRDLYISFVINENIVKPFGLDCYFCNFSKESKIRRILSKKVEDCHLVCDAKSDDVSHTKKTEL